jgi:hypothetical protein
MSSGLTSTTPDNLVLDVGVLSVDGVPIGISQGGLDFDPGITERQIEFDGARAPIAEMEYRVDYKSVIKGSFIELSSEFLALMEPGGSVAGGITTPIPCGQRYAAGDYMTNVVMLQQRGDGSTFAVKFATAKIVKWKLDSKDKRETKIDCEIMAYLSRSEAVISTDTCPYTLVEA